MLTVRRGVNRILKGGLYALRRRAGPPEPRVLAYHSVDGTGSLQSISPSGLRAHLALLKDGGWRGLTLAEFFEHREHGTGASARAVLLTFDDGYVNFAEVAAPLLAEFGCPATVFVVTDDMGGRPGWFERDRAAIERFLDRFAFTAGERAHWRRAAATLAGARLMSWAQARELVAAGFDVQSHSASHRFLPFLETPEILADLQRSRATLEDRLGVRADVVCYPYGETCERVVGAARAAGFRAGFISRYPGPGRDPFRLERIGVSGATTPFDLRFALSTALDTHAAIQARLPRLGARLGRGRASPATREACT